MIDIADLPATERSELLRQCAAKSHFTEQILEKDFWVCWILKRLFESPLSDKLIFKGGTSLSKVYGLIKRFSEDIDLILNWTGNPVGDPLSQRSKRGQEKFNKELLEWSNQQIKEHIYPEIKKLCANYCIAKLEYEKTGDAIISIEYPLTMPADRYLRPTIKLEIGALAAWTPYQESSIHPYVADYYPQLIHFPDATIKVTTAERTFWEKATIMHTEAGRPMSTRLPDRYSRHYYDMYMLSHCSELKRSAFSNLSLLQRVVEFKQRFYSGSRWLAYELAKPGTFRVQPPAYHIPILQKDYERMRDMIYGERPTFNEILAGLGELEKEINSLG